MQLQSTSKEIEADLRDVLNDPYHFSSDSATAPEELKALRNLKRKQFNISGLITPS